MNQERQKTDAIADAVEIPEGATHYITDGDKVLFLLIKDSGLIDYVTIKTWRGFWDYLIDCPKKILFSRNIQPL